MEDWIVCCCCSSSLHLVRPKYSVHMMAKTVLFVLFNAICLWHSIAFIPSPALKHRPNQNVYQFVPTSRVSLSMNKGFGKDVPVKQNSKKNAKGNVIEDTTSVSTPKPQITPTPTSTGTTISAGAKALADLRRQQAEDKDKELRAIREMKAVDEYVANDPDAAVIPEQVAQRMGQRMLPFVGIPLFGVMGTFIVFWYLATYRNLEFQPALVAFSTIAVLGVSLLVRIMYIVNSININYFLYQF